MPSPGRMAFMPSAQMIKGTGRRVLDVDDAFARNTKDFVESPVQVHGHRNDLRLPVAAAPRSYNLEGRVEFDGALRILTFTAAGEILSREFAYPLEN